MSKYFISFYAEVGEEKQFGNAEVTTIGKMKMEKIEEFMEEIKRQKGLDYVSVISFHKV